MNNFFKSLKQLLLNYRRTLSLSRWPILTAEEVKIIEQKKKLDRLYGR